MMRSRRRRQRPSGSGRLVPLHDCCQGGAGRPAVLAKGAGCRLSHRRERHAQRRRPLLRQLCASGAGGRLNRASWPSALGAGAGQDPPPALAAGGGRGLSSGSWRGAGTRRAGLGALGAPAHGRGATRSVGSRVHGGCSSGCYAVLYHARRYVLPCSCRWIAINAVVGSPSVASVGWSYFCAQRV